MTDSLARLTRDALSLAVSVAFCGHVAAQQLELDPLVVSGSRSAAASLDLPFSVDSVSARQIRDGQLGINASEALARVPGLVVQNRQNYAQDLQISSRGFGARSAFGVRGIKLITDGIPASTPDGQGQAATFNLDSAERIEVLRGPASVLYGSNAGGVVQMFSRDGQGSPRIGAGTLFGSDGLRRNRLNAEGAANGVGFLFNASRMDTDGYRDHSAARRDQVFGKLSFTPDEYSRLALVYSSLEQNATDDPLGQSWQGYKADPRSVTANALLYDTRKSIDHQQLGVNYERHFADATLQATFYGGKRHVIQYLAIPPAAQGNARHGGGVVDFERDFHGGSLRWLQPLPSAIGDLRLALGLEYDRSQDDRQGYENFLSSTRLGVKGRLRRDELNTVTSLDPYAQLTWQVGDWTLQGGLRYSNVEIEVDDKYIDGFNGDDSGTQRYRKATPSLSVGYAFTPELNGYFSVARGYETPTLGELAYGVDSSFNRSLSPSISTQYELGLKALLGERARINAALFQIDSDDEIVIADSQDGRTRYQNAGRTQRRGLELGLEAQLHSQWSASLAYTYLRAVYDSSFDAGGSRVDSGNNLPGVPRTTLFVELNWQPLDGLSTALEGFYRSKVYTEDSNREKAAPAYAVFNWRAQLEQRLGDWTLQQTLRLDNLFDRQYVGSVIVGDSNRRYYEAAPGRSWYVGAAAEYNF
ncbi:TonB-dependent receptor family protein [Stutzerimonas kirkiae]|uniref:TonB-dependent receptor family protein n=1 Tax=Stutzerimonas kirkiae TaxID=2211392 RepID=UPI0010383135|nr:TonB-dependent receptor [Stutzerimonas kirkiae]TBV12902.1 TonB-dependent receptor [Stutzerimonas kirkiae]